MKDGVEAMSVSEGDYEPDPVFLSSLREARWILLMWVGCFVWTLAVALSSAYPDAVNPDTFGTVFGIPAWVAWGIALPWLLADGVTIWFCLTQMEDADLDIESADELLHESGSESGDGNAE